MMAQTATYIAIGILALLLLVGGAGAVVATLINARKNMQRRITLVSEATSRGLSTEMGSPSNLVRFSLEAKASREQRAFARLLIKWKVGPARAFMLYTAAKPVLAILFAVLVIVLAGHRPIGLLLAIGAGAAGWTTPFLVGRSLAGGRTRLVVEGLPEAIELMVVCVDAGLALEDTLDRVIAELAHTRPVLVEELSVTNADMKMLPSRDQALFGLAKRIDAPSVRSMVMTLSQTMRYGTPLAQALRTVASELRNDSILRLEERANMLPTLLTIPMMIFIMPTIFLVIGGPAALRLIDTFLR
jgi:tight adherence protein C